jgi:hypothetical protein
LKRSFQLVILMKNMRYYKLTSIFNLQIKLFFESSLFLVLSNSISWNIWRGKLRYSNVLWN